MTADLKLFNLVMLGVRQVNGCVKATCQSVTNYLFYYFCVPMTKDDFQTYVGKALEQAASLGYLEECEGEYWVTGLSPPSGSIVLPNATPWYKAAPPCPPKCTPVSIPSCPPSCSSSCSSSSSSSCPPPKPPSLPKRTPCPRPCPTKFPPSPCPPKRPPPPPPPRPPKCPGRCISLTQAKKGVLPKCTFELQERKLARTGLLLTPTVAVAAKRKNCSASITNKPVGKVRPLPSSSPSCSSSSHQLELKPKEEILAFHISQKKKSLLQQRRPKKAATGKM